MRKFNAEPEPLDENVVHEAHLADPPGHNAMLQQLAGKRWRGELQTLVGGEAEGLAPPLRVLFDVLDAEGSLQGVGEAQGEHGSAVLVHDGAQVAEAQRETDVGHVRGLGDVGRVHLETVARIRGNRVRPLCHDCKKDAVIDHAEHQIPPARQQRRQ